MELVGDMKVHILWIDLLQVFTIPNIYFLSVSESVRKMISEKHHTIMNTMMEILICFHISLVKS